MNLPDNISEEEREEIHIALVKRKENLEKLSKKTDEEEVPTDRIEERLALYRDRDDLQGGRKVVVAGLLSMFAAEPSLSLEERQRRADEERKPDAAQDTFGGGSEVGGGIPAGGKDRWNVDGHEPGTGEPETRDDRKLPPGSSSDIADADFEIVDDAATRSEDDVRQGNGERVLDVQILEERPNSYIVGWTRGEGTAAVFAGSIISPAGEEDPWAKIKVADLKDADTLEVPKPKDETELVAVLIEPRDAKGDVGQAERIFYLGKFAPEAETGDGQPL